MKIAAQIVGLSIMSFLFASGILGFCISGPIGVLATPIIAIFGWFLFPLVVAGYAIAWALWKKSRLSRLAFCLLLSVVAAMFFAFIGPKEEGKFIQGLLGYSLGALIPGFAALWVLTSNKINREEEEGIAPGQAKADNPMPMNGK